MDMVGADMGGILSAFGKIQDILDEFYLFKHKNIQEPKITPDEEIMKESTGEKTKETEGLQQPINKEFINQTIIDPWKIIDAMVSINKTDSRIYVVTRDGVSEYYDPGDTIYKDLIKQNKYSNQIKNENLSI